MLVSRDHDSGLVAFSMAEVGAALPDAVRVLEGPVAALVEDMLDEAVEHAARTGDKLTVDLDELVIRAETRTRRRRGRSHRSGAPELGLAAARASRSSPSPSAPTRAPSSGTGTLTVLGIIGSPALQPQAARCDEEACPGHRQGLLPAGHLNR
jgi:hypothetical protein